MTKSLKKVAIISGVTGMTGCETACQLLKKDFIVVGFDNFFASNKNSVADFYDYNDFYFFEYDINNISHMMKLNEFMKNNFSHNAIHIINCAAVVHTKYFYSLNDTFETNVLSMKRFLDFSIKLKAKSFINCSTSEVYSCQSWTEDGVKESDPILMSTVEHSQRTSYAAGKLLTEFFLKEAVDNKNINGCSIRFANVYSNYELYDDHIIPYIVNSFKKSNKIKLLENSKINKRTFLHNYDSCTSILALLENKNSLDGSTYNVGTDEEISILGLIKIIAEKMRIIDPQITFSGFRKSDPERRLLNTHKIRAITGWRPRISLEQGLDMVIKESKNIA